MTQTLLSYPRAAFPIFFLLCLLAGCSPVSSKFKPSPTWTVVRHTPQAAVPQSAPPCILSELTGNASWQGATGALVGRVELVNYGKTSCSLRGQPKIDIFNQNGWQLLVVQSPVEDSQPGQVIVLDPGKANPVTAAFTWRNWCAPAKPIDLHLVVTLPAYPGKLELPVQDPNGRPLGDTPRCDAQELPSILQVENFQP